jgi:hypothetical protein
MSNTLAFEEKETRDWLRGLLQEGVMTIRFKKADGTDRVMICTLSESKIPNEHKPKGTTKRMGISEEVQVVFDLEANGWRSFRWESINQLSFDLGG